MPDDEIPSQFETGESGQCLKKLLVSYDWISIGNDGRGQCGALALSASLYYSKLSGVKGPVKTTDTTFPHPSTIRTKLASSYLRVEDILMDLLTRYKNGILEKSQNPIYDVFVKENPHLSKILEMANMLDDGKGIFARPSLQVMKNACIPDILKDCTDKEFGVFMSTVIGFFSKSTVLDHEAQCCSAALWLRMKAFMNMNEAMRMQTAATVKEWETWNRFNWLNEVDLALIART